MTDVVILTSELDIGTVPADEHVALTFSTANSQLSLNKGAIITDTTYQNNSLETLQVGNVLTKGNVASVIDGFNNSISTLTTQLSDLQSQVNNLPANFLSIVKDKSDPNVTNLYIISVKLPDIEGTKVLFRIFEP